MRLGSAYIAIKAKLDELRPALQKARAQVAGFASSMKKRIASINFKAVALSAVAAAGVMTYAMKGAVDTASSLEEVTSKFETVFKDQERAAYDMAEVLVDAYAMSTREAKQYLASVQDLLVPMGMEAEAAATLSGEIVKLSADLGSFNNLPTAKVMDDIQSALVGNYETMKKYGVVLNATIVQEKALAMGLAATKEELTASHKAQAAYALMVEASQAAVGDMARTSESYANQTKQLTANIEEFRAALGEKLLPMATKVVMAMNNWYKANKELISQDMAVWIENIKYYLAEAWYWIQYIGFAVYDWYLENEKLIKSSLIIFLEGVYKIAKSVAWVFMEVGRAIGEAIAKIVTLIERGNALKAMWAFIKEAFSYAPAALAMKDTKYLSDMSEDMSGPGYASGTGLSGLPRDGLFYGHKGEIVKNKKESDEERRGSSKPGNTYNITVKTMFGDEASMRNAAFKLKRYLSDNDKRLGTAT